MQIRREIIKNICLSIILLILFWLLFPYASYQNSFIAIYCINTIKRLLIQNIYIIRNYKTIKEENLIKKFIYVFIPFCLLFHLIIDLVFIININIIFRLSPEEEEFFQRFFSKVTSLEYCACFNYMYGEFLNKTPEDKLRIYDECVDKLGRVNAKALIYYDDLCIIKYMSGLNEYSDEAKAILKGLSNDRVIQRTNAATHGWIWNIAKKNLIHAELGSLRPDLLNHLEQIQQQNQQQTTISSTITNTDNSEDTGVIATDSSSPILSQADAFTNPSRRSPILSQADAFTNSSNRNNSIDNTTQNTQPDP